MGDKKVAALRVFLGAPASLAKGSALQSLLKTFINGLREEFGYPASLIRLLASHPQICVSLPEPASNISARSVVPWHELGAPPVLHWPRRDRGFLMGWHASGSHWQSFSIECPAYADIGRLEITDTWYCDVADIHGFSASRSDLTTFPSTDAMAEQKCRGLIAEISPAKIEESLAHGEIRIIHSPGTTADHFARYRWDNRLWLINEGGSHHTAAAKYIATRLGQPVTLKGKLYTYSLNASAIAALRREFEVFVINDDTEISNAWFDAMCAFKATWLWHHMPQPHQDTRAILLPRQEARSRRVAAELRKAGAFDLGAYLAALAARQTTAGPGEQFKGDKKVAPVAA